MQLKLPTGFLFILLFLYACSDATTTEGAGLIAIKNVTLIDAVQGQRDNVTVIWEENKIKEVVDAASAALPKGATVIDGTGKFLIPGLWDAHVHLAYEQGVTPAMFKLFLVNGVTSIRDTGGHLELVKPHKDAAEANPKASPRVKISGPLLDGLPRVYDGSSTFRPNLSEGINSIQKAKNFVARLDAAGVDLIKAYEMLAPDVYEAVVAEATKRGLPVTGHVPLSIDVITASNAGLRSIEHMRNLEMSCTADWEKLLKTRKEQLAAGKSEAGGDLRSRLHQLQRYYAIEHQDATVRDTVLATLARNNTWLVPTLTILAFRENRVYARPEWREQFKYLPDSTHKKWVANAERLATLPIDSNGVAFAEWGYDMVGRLPDAGVEVMAGTDTPIALLTPGFSLHEELRLLVRSGLTPLQAIEAATLRPAEYFDMQDELGTIQGGKLADLLLLDANPLADISNTESIRAVVRDGKLYDRAALDTWLQELEAE